MFSAWFGELYKGVDVATAKSTTPPGFRCLATSKFANPEAARYEHSCFEFRIVFGVA